MPAIQTPETSKDSPMKNVSASIPVPVWRSSKQAIFDAQAEGTELKTWDSLITCALEKLLSKEPASTTSTVIAGPIGVLESFDQELASGLRKVLRSNHELRDRLLTQLRSVVAENTKGTK